jgi:hypothetical protein
MISSPLLEPLLWFSRKVQAARRSCIAVRSRELLVARHSTDLRRSALVTPEWSSSHIGQHARRILGQALDGTPPYPFTRCQSNRDGLEAVPYKAQDVRRERVLGLYDLAVIRPVCVCASSVCA